ncbi:MAG: HAD family hydrolase [Patescibacteria group bacterium]|nr:HAD family hydrolase [Patescibacteria group bacterium]
MKVVLFDWNGTVLNDIPVWHESVKEIFCVYGKNPPTIAEYFSELEGDYLQIYQSRGIVASRDELNAIYEPFYEAHISEAVLFPSAKDVLLLLARLGIRIGLVTAQKENLVSPLLDKFGLSDLFWYKAFHALDKKSAIQRIVADADVCPENCYFVGDAPSDIRHGKKAGIKTIAFLGGYIPESLVISAKPDTIHYFREIVSMMYFIK